MGRVARALALAVGLAMSFAIAHAINWAAVWVADHLLGYGDYLWTQFYAMGLAVLYTFYALLVIIYVYEYPRLSEKLSPPQELPTVTVIVPAYNEEGRIGKALSNIFSLDYPREKLEVVVVDDGSNDDTVKIASNYPVKIVKHERNMGRGYAIMSGIKVTSGEVVVTVDADTYPAKNALKFLAGIFVKEPDVGAACGMLKPLGNGGAMLRAQRTEYILGFAYTKNLRSSTGWMLIPSGAFSAYRRSLVEDVDVGDTLAEDFDLGVHIAEMGLKLRYVKEAVAHTEVPTDIRGFVRQRVRWAVGGLQVMAKHRDTMMNIKHGLIGLFALPFHFTTGFTVMVMEVFGLSFLLGLALTGHFTASMLGALALWLFALRVFSLTLLLPGVLYARRVLGEPIGLGDILHYWLVYYYLLLCATVLGTYTYLARGSVEW